MKKFTLFACAMLFIITVQAQEVKDYKPTGSEWNAEVNFDPFSSSPINISYIRLRKFMSESSALRLGVSIAGESDKPDENIKRSTFTINLRPGYEHHFTGTDRISPYVGAELDFALKSTKEEDTSNDATLTGAYASGAERGFTRIGLNALLGVDFYVVKNLYLGTEIGFGFEIINEADIEIDPDPVNQNPLDEGGSSFQFGPNFNSSLRLGFIF
ncbi:MAG: hypothetical protein ABJH05_15615 [Fulvivirga sp.]